MLLPRHPGLPAPQTLLQRSAAGDRVSLLYAAEGERPAIEDADVGLLVTQFPGAMERDMLEKLAHEPSQVSPVTVDGLAAWWIDGAHSILYVAPDGQVVEEPLRLASSTLVWHRDGVTFRLESALDLERTVEIAESMTRR
ncbi:MAG TPA: hypothetical protein VML96_05305 [Egibacteraceae bacterium]|nr:hypothetical protein [Egibacteraceae bacterium]